MSSFSQSQACGCPSLPRRTQPALEYVMAFLAELETIMRLTWIHLPAQANGPTRVVHATAQSFVRGSGVARAAGLPSPVPANRIYPPLNSKRTAGASVATHCHSTAHVAPPAEFGRARAASDAE